MIKILFVGETWRGSSARSLREGLEMIPNAIIEEVAEDHYFPRHRKKLLRGINRLLRSWQVEEFENNILAKIGSFYPDVLLVYKGSAIGKRFLMKVKKVGLFVVNVFPDASPHAHGKKLREAMGFYDLVISTKPFHAANWNLIYGYMNRCLFVPHGYDPAMHYWPDTPEVQDLDVVLAASWRPEYHELMLKFAVATSELRIRVALSGPGWYERRSAFPSDWEFDGPFYGRNYCHWLRRGKIVIAPVQSKMAIRGVQQPGDEDTTRSYELAAAGCFFVHKRTPYIQAVYDELAEVPMWDSAEELAGLVQRYLPLAADRLAMAARAHRRAVPEYSIPTRAQKVFEIIDDQLNIRQGLQ